MECPLIEIDPLDEPAHVDTSGYDWVIVTSPNGADLFAQRRRGDHARIAAVGPGTAETLRRPGIEPDLVPRVSTQEGLLDEFPVPSGRVLFVGAEGSRRVLIDALDADFVPLYRTRLLRPAPPEGDLVVLASGSAARSFAAVGGRPRPCRSARRRRRAARAAGLDVVAGSADPRPRRSRRRRRRGMFVTFLTDFGLQDDFVGTCHGVIKRIAPEVEVIDITHGIPPRAIVQGALVLANTVPYMPVGVHLAVVDPGVGGPRRALALRDAEGRAYVGPDNGLLLPAAERAGIAEAHEIVNPEYALSPVSRTFHGRDIFAPAAAHRRERSRGRGARPADRSERARPARAAAAGGAREPDRREILYVDAFGNMQLNLTREHLEQADVQPGARVELELAGQRYYAIAARTFSDARTGDLILYEDSYGNVAVAMNRGNAAEMLAARAGRALRMSPGRAVSFGTRFARLATDVVVRRPTLWPLFRSARSERSSTGSPRQWDSMRGPDSLAPFEAALAGSMGP